MTSWLLRKTMIWYFYAQWYRVDTYECDKNVSLRFLSIPQEYALMEHISYGYSLVRDSQHRSVKIICDKRRSLSELNKTTLDYFQNSSYDFTFTRYPEFIPPVANQNLLKFPIAAG